MPRFDIKCLKCHLQEEVILTACPSSYLVDKECSRCGTSSRFEVLPPLTAMQPDKYWAGHQVHGKHITSNSFLKRYRKQNNLERVDRSILEEVQKKEDDRKENPFSDRSKKFLHDTIAEEVKQLNLPND